MTSQNVAIPGVERAPRNRVDRAAAVVSEILAPVVLAYVVCLAVAIGTTPPLARGLLVGVVVATFAAGLPYLVVLRGSRRGDLSGRHVPDGRERPLILGLAASSAIAAFPAALLLQADRAVIALLAATTVGLIVAAVISTAWKLSIHVAGAAGAASALALVYGPQWWLLVVVVVVLAWSRVRLGAHDLPQVAGGAVVGGLVTVTVCLTLL